MKDKSLVCTCNYHLDDNPATFQDATYVGHTLELPMHVRWVDEHAPAVVLWISTRHIETWGDGQGHTVTLNGEEVGRLRDKDDQMGMDELCRISIDARVFRDIAAKQNGRFTLGIQVERKLGEQGLSDDFIFNRLESEHAVFRLGW